jgi:acyl-CoA thioesterase-1
MNIGILQNGAKFTLGFAAALALTLGLAACGSEADTDDAAIAPAAASGEIADGEIAIPVMGEQVDIVAFGDSLFAGYGLDNPRDSYPAKLEAALRTRGTNAAISNAGVSGDTSAAGLSRLAFVLDQLDETPDLLILELGGNDLLRNIQPAETRSNFSAMLTILREREIPVLMMGMRAPPNYGPEYQAEFDAIYADLAQEFDAELIPFWMEDIYEDASLFQSDRIHPTAEGIEALVASTVDAVSAALPEDEG